MSSEKAQTSDRRAFFPLRDKVTTFIESLVNCPKRWLALSFCMIALAAIGTTRIESFFSVKGWLFPDNQKIIDLEQFENDFGGSESIDIVVYHPQGIFYPETIKAIHKLTDELWMIPGVERIQSLSNYNWIEADNEEINTTPFLDPDKPLTENYVLKRKQQAITDAEIKNFLISGTGNLAYIRCILGSHLKSVPYKEIVEKAEQIIAGYESNYYEISLSGIAFINHTLSRASDKDMQVIFPIVIILLVGVLLIFFRSVLAIVFTFSLIFLTILVTFGIEGLLGIPFNNILAAMPAILLSIGLADSIHVIISYRHNILFEKMAPKLAAIKSLKKNFIPTVLTTVTTATGFFSLTLTEIKPIFELGLLSGIGTIVAWFMTYFFLGPLLSKIKFNPKKVSNDSMDLKNLYRWTAKFKTPIIIALSLLSLTMGYLGSLNSINADPVRYFSPDSPVRIVFDLISKEFGGSRSIELVFDSNEDDGIKDPQFLKKSDDFLGWIEQRQHVAKVTSILQILKKINKTLNADNPDFYKIADDRSIVAEHLFFYTFGLPEGADLRNQLSDDYRKFKATILWNIDNSEDSIRETRIILAEAKKRGLNVQEGGQSPIYNQINELVVKTFFISISFSLPTIFFIILIFFRDLKISLLSLIPNVFPLSIASGIMYLSGDYVNIGNVIVFSVCLGIAVDDTIHFLANYKLRIMSGKSNRQALEETLSQTGKALILTTMMLCLGFGMFIIGDFVPNQKFGIYCSVILSLAIIADLILLPAILTAIDDRKPKSDQIPSA